MLNQSEPNVILTAHATKVNRPEPNWTEPQTCLAGRNHALSFNNIRPIWLDLSVKTQTKQSAGVAERWRRAVSMSNVSTKLGYLVLGKSKQST